MNLTNSIYPTGTEFYYVYNGQGDVIGLLDGAGTKVVTYTYDSWGKPITTTGTLATTVGVDNSYRYRGYGYDSETGLYYLQSRYYNPVLGRFISADGTFGYAGELLATNMFAYCINNPVNMSDQYGDRPAFDSVEDEQAYYKYMHKIKSGQVDLGKGYKGRVDEPHVKNDQDHVHIKKGNKEVANQNADGTPHHKNKNKEVPTSKVKKKLKEETNWDWDATAAKQNIAKGIVVTGGTYLVYRGVRMIPSLFPPLWWTLPVNALTP